ncbi:MAG: Mur ligase [Chloroflexi bacterium]|nr:MAG: Mur ligase [Chloroflexota bacterium]
MQLVEIRDLDGPNLFLLQPAIKIELVVSPDDRLTPEAAAALAEHYAFSPTTDPISALKSIIAALHRQVGLDVLELGERRLDAADHIVVYYPWQWRSCSVGIAQHAVEALIAGDITDATESLRSMLATDQATNDTPLWVRDNERNKPTVAITGTNGKTTTTRLVAHICREAGRHTGWSSSSGVYIDGVQVMEGDYTGPSGARRVLEDPDVEIAVLETARGGILLRGVAFESTDVAVMINVTSDHLSLQGIETVDTLAEVKSVVVRLAKPEGLVVLNADDPRVAAQRRRVRAEVLFTTQDIANPVVVEHIAAGGRVLARIADAIVLIDGDTRTHVIDLVDTPITWGGVARHMVENSLCAAGAALGLGFSIEQIAHGLHTFRSDIRSNAGRLNVFRLNGRIIVVDYAHNESGLEALIQFARGLMGGSGRLSAIVGTAGDRQDDVLTGIGRIAARRADRVYIKENLRYLRGRPAEEIVALIRRGVNEGEGLGKLAGIFPSEHAALVAALDRTDPGDAVAIMCVQDQLAIYRELRDRGAEEWR